MPPAEITRFVFNDGRMVIVELSREQNLYTAQVVDKNERVTIWQHRAVADSPLQGFGCDTDGKSRFLLSYFINYTKDLRGLIPPGEERIDYQDAMLFIVPCEVGLIEKWSPPNLMIWFGYTKKPDDTVEFRGVYDGASALIHLIHRDLGQDLFKEVRGFPPQRNSTTVKDDTVEILLTIRQRQFKYWHRLNTDEWKVSLVAEMEPMLP